MRARRGQGAVVSGLGTEERSQADARGIWGPVGRLVASSLLLGLILGASSARADHIPGATYTGSHSGGGTVEFVVSADGGTVTV